MDNSKICVTSINYDSGRIATCVVSINEKNYTVRWVNEKYEVAAGGEVVNCGAATKSGAKPGTPVASAPVAPVASAPVASAPVAAAPVAAAPVAPKPVVPTSFTTHEELIERLMTDQKLRPV
jgi:hypothetical protein